MDTLLIRPREAAEVLGISKSKVYDMCASGELPILKIGKSVRIPAEELRRWINERVIHSTEVPSD